MSGEFGRYQYFGYIDSVIRQIAENCIHGDSWRSTAPTYSSTALIGHWLEDYFAPVMKNLTYNEAGDSHPAWDDVETINRAIEALIKTRDEIIQSEQLTAPDGQK